MVKRTTLAAPFICLLLLFCQRGAAQTGPAALAAAPSSDPALAQSTSPETRRFEVGAHFSLLRYHDYLDYGTEPGVGGRFTVNVNDHLAVEAEVDLYPRTHAGDPTVSGRKTLALFGVKAGSRFGRFGFFGKARPGFIHLARRLEFSCIGIGEPVDCELSRINFALDLGGVAEYHFSPRLLLRLDLGDTIIHADKVGGRGLTHNLQMNAGVGFRF
ncbi:MAG TPA: outer membrane beta-barrel protein [Pyrinomonadaceae bacterium]|nr:outer membrane beta-barrel protein [Pyrinomonadaceae bacterium]